MTTPASPAYPSPENALLTGRVHSFQSLGTLDGPGVRFVVFAQGCPLRCGCCHNPDTWDPQGGEAWTPEDILKKAVRFREYFGEEGGITVSGGEPLLQPDFVRRLFELCHEAGLNTCLDTSGCILNEAVERLLDVTDRVLLDIKYTGEYLYRQHVGCSMEGPMRFLARLNERGIPTTLRQVTIPTLNDDEASVRELRRIAEAHTCVDKVELLPFRKVCQVKYDEMKLEFPFAHLPSPDGETMHRLRALLPESLGEAHASATPEHSVGNSLSSGKKKTAC